MAHRSDAPPALLAFFRAIAAGERATVSRLLAKSRPFASQAITEGATRADPSNHFFQSIAHYVYAGDTALHVAAAAYQPAIADELVSRGANPSARNRRGAEPLHYAADGIPGSSFWNPDAQSAVVRFLILAGADPNARDKSGVGPLHRAVRTRSTPAVRALLLNGADPVGRNKSGSTPLHLAVQDTGRGASGSSESRAQQEEIITLLLKQGARPTDTDGAGRSVKDCARAEWIHRLL